MRKRAELTDANSCLSKAGDEEITFVLLSRDPVAPAAIRYWCLLRVSSGKNQKTDPQIVEAMECAAAMEREGAFHKPVSPTDEVGGLSAQTGPGRTER